jgi:hypothetical protein
MAETEPINRKVITIYVDSRAVQFSAQSREIDRIYRMNRIKATKKSWKSC